MTRVSHAGLTLLTVICLVAVRTAQADATLRLEVVGPNQNVEPGQPVQVRLYLTDLGGNEAAGFQAFLQYDQSELNFVSGSYTAAPFGLWVLDPIAASGGLIDLAAGIDVINRQPPTSADSLLVTLNFTSVAGGCGVRSVRFRTHNPPTRVTSPLGQSIVPLNLESLPGHGCAADFVINDAVNVSDLLALVGGWGPCPPTPTCCVGNLNNDQTVNVTDLLILIGMWGPCP
jgi:hypothetical protein